MNWKDTEKLLAVDPKALLSAGADGAEKVRSHAAAVAEEGAKAEAALLRLHDREQALPEEIAKAQSQEKRLEGIIADAAGSGRADLEAAARQRLQGLYAQLKGLLEEAEGLDAEITRANDALVALQDREAELEGILADLPAPAAVEVAVQERSEGAGEAVAAADEDDLDAAFMALLEAENIDLDDVAVSTQIDLPDDDDFGIPELIEVGEDELPEGEELPPLEEPKAAKKQQAPVPAKAQQAPAKAAKPAEEKKGRRWPWVVVLAALGGGGAAAYYFMQGGF